MGSLGGTIRNLVGDELSAARVSLIPAQTTTIVGSETRVDGLHIDLDPVDGSFLVFDVPDGTYQVRIRFYNPPARAKVDLLTVPFPIAGYTVLGTALGLALLTGPFTNVISLDTDGQPYFVPDGTGDYAIYIDTDGQPYYGTGFGGEDVYVDVDGAPVILTLP